jgi:hypothetical protein
MANKAKKRREAKSSNYQKRREEHLLRNNNAWGDVNSLYEQCVQLLSLPATIAPMAQRPEIIRNIENMADFNERCQALAADIRNLSEKLKDIQAQHADKSGSAKGADEFTLAIKIYEQYVQFMEVHNSTCKPVFDEIMEMISRAGVIATNKETEAAIAAAATAQSQAQDPTHTDPIDVPVKEA